MKKFKFNLEKLKDYREQILDGEKNKLAVIRRELSELHTKRENIISEIAEKSSELMGKAGSGISPFMMASAQRFILVKRKETVEVTALIAAKEEEAEKQLGKVTQATRDFKVTEKLKEKKLAEYHVAEAKENEIFIEEFVQNSNYRKEKD